MIAKSFYGFKAHVEITYDGYIINYVITKASVHDAVEALELITSSPYYQLLVDVGYVCLNALTWGLLIVEMHRMWTDICLSRRWKN